MKLYQLYSRQILPISSKQAWNFLSDPANLKVITPEHMGFNILGGADLTMYPGQLIQYKVSPFLGISTRWVTEITHVLEGSYFVDEQRFGPYALWHHKHFIKAVDEGTEMIDIIDYKLPFGFLGRLFHGPIVKKQLEKIFAYRANKLKALFGSISNSDVELTFRTI